MSYEHFRNDLLLMLEVIFNRNQIDIICGCLDKVASNYDITEKVTSLVVYEADEVPKLVKLYIASKRLEGLSEKSLKFYAYRLRTFSNRINKPLEDVTTNEIRMFLATYQQTEHISDRTLDKFRQIINGFYEWCTNEEYLTKNPCRNIRTIKYEVTPRKSLTRFQLEQLRRACTTERELAIVDTLYSTGCRVSELVNMKRSDIVGNSIEIIGKGKKHNTCYFNTNAQLSLQAYMDTRTDDSDYLFVGRHATNKPLSTRCIEDIFVKLASITNLRVTPHIMRHTSATLAVQSGMKLTEVQKMLGHSSVSTTQIYAEIAQSDVMLAHERYVV